MRRVWRYLMVLLLLAGSLAGWSTGDEAPERTVVINEVAWAGTAASSSDEWIELYNNTDEAIDLTGWHLKSDDGSPDVKLSGKIPARGFFLLERSDDGTISDITADQIYQGALTNSGEALRLLDPEGELIDSANGDGGPWPGGTEAQGKPPYASMERIDPTKEDTDANWASNDGTHRCGLDARGNPLNGTPKATNSASNRPPVAAFTFSPSEPLVEELVIFDGSSSTDPDGKIIRFDWSFGDGFTGEGQTASHKYEKAGSYTVRLTVTDDRLAQGTAEKDVVVREEPRPLPVADFSYWPLDPTTEDEIQFMDQSSAQDGEIVAWRWDFGDGATAEVQSPSHRYAKSGTYTVTLSVTDDRGGTDDTSQEIRVRGVPPKASFTVSPERAYTGEVITFDASASDDPDGEIVKYEWDFDGNGEFEECLTAAKVTHSYADNGTYAVKLRVTDDEGETATAQGQVQVLNRAPRAALSFDPEKPTDADTIQFKDDSSDPDGQVVKWSWDFGDGTSSTEQNPTHQYQVDGDYGLELTVWDNDGDSDTVSRTIQVANAPPICDFSFSPTRPTVADEVQFTDLSHDPSPTGRIENWGWDFGDGTNCPSNCGSGNTRNPTHRYTAPGTYTVTLWVIDNKGAMSRTSKQITVIAP
ncbi:MAG: PKD domain-containing protein [Candidatus Acetothermia bacterium]|nr:PKD domain-containing protein [Candidatus Acetothermia bacterium]